MASFITEKLFGLKVHSDRRDSERDRRNRPFEPRYEPRYTAEPSSYDYQDDDRYPKRGSHSRRSSHRDVREDDRARARHSSRRSSHKDQAYDENPYPSEPRRDSHHSRHRDDDRSTRKREPLPATRPSSSAVRRHTTIDKSFSYISPVAEEYYDPGDHTSHKDMYSNARPPTPPVLNDGTIVPPLRRRDTEPTALDRRTRRVAQEIWEEDPHFRPGSRTVEIPNSDAVKIMSEATWLGGKIDRKLATDIAFTDVDYARERDILSKQEQEEFTRCYFPNLDTYRLRLRAQTATSLREFDEIFTGMKESVMRGIVYTARAGIRPLTSSDLSRPHQDPLYLSFKLNLENYVDSVKSEWRKRPESHKSEQWAIDRFRAKYGDFVASKPAIEGRKRRKRSTRYRDQYE